MPPQRPGRVKLQVPKLQERIRQEVEKRMRTRLGLSPAQPLPSEVSTLIKNTADSAARKAVEMAVVRDAEATAKETARGVMFESFGDKVSAARKGIDFIAQSGDVSGILKRRAELLFAKRKALQDAGFSTEEAMNILLTDIAARGH